MSAVVPFPRRRRPAPASRPARAPRGRASSAEATRGRLLERARQVFSERGYVRTTVSDVVAGTGLSRGAFYRYFESVDAIFVETIGSVIDELVAASKVHDGRTQRERVRAGNRRYLEIFAKHGGVMRALAEAAFVDPDIQAIQARLRGAYLRRLRDHLRRQCALGRCHPLDPDAATLALGMMVEGVAMSWIVTGLEPFERPLEIERVCTQVTDLWCRAVYLEPDRVLGPPRRPAGPRDAAR
ncbi:MAG: TetR/AcrR family transcriptional regulator [Burkholderiaceae bacterium]